MTLAQSSLGALILAPLLAATIMVVLPHAARRVLGVVTAIAVTTLSSILVVTVAPGEVIELSLAGYDAPVGIMLRADGMSALFVAMTTIIGLCTTSFAAAVPSTTGVLLRRRGATTGYHPGFWPLWFGCWAGLNAVFVAGDLFNTYIGLELVGLTAVGMVALGGRAAWPAALRYLFIAVLGSLFFLVAVGMLVSVTGTLDIQQSAAALSPLPESAGVAVIAVVLLSIGLAMKIALVPMHQWLVPAHAGAPSAVSPLLSALVIKAALFVFLRCWMWLIGPVYTPALQDGVVDDVGFSVLEALTIISWIFAGLGVLALIVGSILALQQTHLKPLIAYSTVAQVGYWFLFLPILVIPDSDSLGDPGVTEISSYDVITGALSGTIALVIGHGLAKAALFLAAGYFKERYGTDEIEALRGVARTHPALVMTMGLSAIGLAGLPFSLSFVGKWQLTSASLSAGHYWILPVIVIATLLSAGYLLRAIAPLLMAPDDDSPEQQWHDRTTAELPAVAQIAPFVLGVLTVATGFLGVPVVELLAVGAP